MIAMGRGSLIPQIFTCTNSCYKHQPFCLQLYNDRTLIIKGSPNCNGPHKCMHNLYIRVGQFLLVRHVVVSCLLCHNLIIIHIGKSSLVHLEDFAVVVLVHDSQ